MSNQIVKKITVRKVAGVTPKPENGKSQPLLHVYGLARGFDTKETDKGPYLLFRGDFEAANMDGELFRAGQMILPGVAESALGGVVEDGNAVQFAFEIGVTGSENSVTGYEYYCKPLVDSGESDALASLRNSLPKLAAPKAK